MRCWMILLLAGVLAGCPVDDYEGDAPGECADGADNDRDGAYDCDDPDCAESPDCAGDDDDAVDDDDVADDDDAVGDDDDAAGDDDDSVADDDDAAGDDDDAAGDDDDAAGDDDDASGDDDDAAVSTTVVLVQNLLPEGCTWTSLEFDVEQDGLGIATIAVVEANRPFGMVVDAGHEYQLDLDTAPTATCDTWSLFATWSGSVPEDCYYLMSIAADGAPLPDHWFPGSLLQCEGVDYVADQVRIAFTEGTLPAYAQSQIEDLGFTAVQTRSDPVTFLVTNGSGLSAPEMTLALASVDQLWWVAPDPI